MADFYLQFAPCNADTAETTGRLVGAHDNLTMPVYCLMEYRGRVDAVLSYFVEGFLHDDVFGDGDSLWMRTVSNEKGMLLLRKNG
jgi:hypothetical protein